MVRTQIQLTDHQSKMLKSLAAVEGTSIAELIRRSVDLYLRGRQVRDREELKQDALGVVGKYMSELDDVGENHDRYLADGYAEVGQ